MLSEEIDLHKIFKINPTAMALLTADFEFIDANEEFLSAIGHPLEEVDRTQRLRAGTQDAS